jgi:bis(5'-nucleosyl)-tetraphosphatase (symmetrical)
MIWAIGDIQGCYKPLKKLLQKIKFNPKKDKLWIAGDLVNRGKGSLETLKYLYSIKDSIEVVLGNHDIALIGAYYGIKKSNATIEPILRSPKAKELIGWLRRQKFLHIDRDLGYCMAHAGISPSFDLKMAAKESKRLEKSLQGNGVKEWLVKMFDGGVEYYDPDASDIDAQRYAIASFVRMRFCDSDGRFDFEPKGSPESESRVSSSIVPWYQLPHRRDIELKIIFGHWSTLGLYSNSDVYSLDTGCVWSGKLTAIRIDDRSEEVVEVDCIN